MRDGRFGGGVGAMHMYGDDGAIAARFIEGKEMSSGRALAAYRGHHGD